MPQVQSSNGQRRPSPREARLAKINASAPPYGRVSHVETVPFGALLKVERFRLDNGLEVLLCEDHSAPVLAYHTWYRVGSRHEKVGKTGLAHLFEHLMFNETEKRKAGEFDRRLEEAGAESNAATWLDWTQYNIAIPKDQLGLVVELEAERMSQLVLRDPQVDSEKEVVANERRYRVDDDVEGAVSELLWATAFTRHAYRWPTIGWMADIEGFTTEDCAEFYKTYYAPNNATLVVVGDVSEATLLRRVSQAYGHLPPSELPLEDVLPEPPQTSERRVEVTKPTATEKLCVGYHGPAMGDFDHPALSLLVEILTGGRASRLHRKLFEEREIATDLRAFVGPFRDPGLVELFVSARGEHRAEELLEVVDAELARVQSEPIAVEELDRARARLELGLLAGLDTVEGKASTLGFYDVVLGRPAGAFERLEATARVTPSDLRRVARRYFDPSRRSVVLVRSQQEAST
ncbi:MAG TPA: pitrilysin family protein [Polyangiaceae bacterium]|nr:pitrilysin family protein [Polyangiaceae bacterium]